MLLTEDKSYAVSVEIEKGTDTGMGSSISEVEFTNLELLHAILTCGMSMQRLTPEYAEKRKREILYKIFLVETALDTEGDRLKKSPRTMYLDSSEKSVISYYLGTFFTKLFSYKLYGIDYLTQLNTIKDSDEDKYIDFFFSKWRPDLIGYHVKEDAWSVWEAKGGSNRRAPALKSGCELAGEVQSINGRMPFPAAVCMTYYDHSYLNAVMKETTGESGKEICFREEDFYASYYEGIRQIFQEYGHTLRWEEGNVEVTIEIPYYHNEDENGKNRFIYMGISEEAFVYLMKRDYSRIKYTKEMPVKKEDGRFTGRDKIYIRTGKE